MSRKPDSALATPPSTNSPLMNSPTPDSVLTNLSKTASPVSPNTLPTMFRMPSRLSPRMLTTATMDEITPTMGSAPDSRLPKPPAIGPQMLLNRPAPAPAIFPAPEPAIRPAAPVTAPPARPSIPDRPCRMTLPWMMAAAPTPAALCRSGMVVRFSHPVTAPPALVFPMAVPRPPTPAETPPIHWPSRLFAAAPRTTLPAPV